MCSKAAQCPFKHEGPGGVGIVVPSALADRPTCWYYDRGCCAKGAQCTFKHEGVKPQDGRLCKRLKLDLLDQPDDDTIFTAVKVALESVSGSEREEELHKLRLKMAKFTREAIQGIRLTDRPVVEIVDEYADALFGKLFQVIGDRPFLEEVDLLLVLDAAVKELLPAESLAEVPADELEGMIFSAHDRCFDVQRSQPVLWEAVQQGVQGPKTRKKVYAAFDAGRRHASAAEHPLEVESTASSAELFALLWISVAIGHLRTESDGYPESILTEETAAMLFGDLFEGGGLPNRFSAEAEGGEPTDGWRAFADAAVKKEYQRPVKPSRAPSRSVKVRPSQGPVFEDDEFDEFD